VAKVKLHAVTNKVRLYTDIKHIHSSLHQTIQKHAYKTPEPFWRVLYSCSMSLQTHVTV